MAESLFYVLSLKWSKRRDRVLTWWGPNNSDYYFRLKIAGKYTAEQVAKNNFGRAHPGGDASTVAIPCEVVDALGVPIGEVNSRSTDRDRDPGDLVVRYEHLAKLKKLHMPKPAEVPRG